MPHDYALFDKTRTPAARALSELAGHGRTPSDQVVTQLARLLALINCATRPV